MVVNMTKIAESFPLIQTKSNLIQWNKLQAKFSALSIASSLISLVLGADTLLDLAQSTE